MLYAGDSRLPSCLAADFDGHGECRRPLVDESQVDDRRIFPVPVVEWPQGSPLSSFKEKSYQAYQQHGRGPVLLRKVPLADWEAWPALNMSPAEHLDSMATGGSLVPPKVGKTSFFQYFNTPMQDHWREHGITLPATDFAWATERSLEELQAFLSGAEKSPEKHWAYWILDIYSQVPHLKSVMQSVSLSAEELFSSPSFNNPSPATSEPMRGFAVNLWLSSPGIANNLHYDGNWNHLVHVHGSKRVLLASPKDAWRFALYPRVHPSLRSSPVDLRQPWGDLIGRFPSLANSSVMEAVLNPGDVLLIPPFWLHFVEVPADSGPSATLSFFSDCPESSLLRARLPRPENVGVAVSRAKSMIEAFFPCKPRVAYRFLRKQVLMRSFQSTLEMKALLCASNSSGIIREPSNGCSPPVSGDGHAGTFANMIKTALPDSRSTWLFLLQAFLEDLALATWGPLEACAGLEYCVLPSVAKISACGREGGKEKQQPHS